MLRGLIDNQGTVQIDSPHTAQSARKSSPGHSNSMAQLLFEDQSSKGSPFAVLDAGRTSRSGIRSKGRSKDWPAA
jgi:hypothetical protein